jgi:hypothetical protein
MSKRRLLMICLRFTLYVLGIAGGILLYAGLVADMRHPPYRRPSKGAQKGLEDRRNAEAKQLERELWGR